jgi:hypothetical protein
MTSFMNFDAAAAERGDGLRPELLALLAGATPCFDLTVRSDGMIQSDPDPASKVSASTHLADSQKRVG